MSHVDIKKSFSSYVKMSGIETSIHRADTRDIQLGECLVGLDIVIGHLPQNVNCRSDAHIAVDGFVVLENISAVDQGHFFV